MWAYGVLLWELFSFGASPYPQLEADPIEVAVAVATGYRLTQPTFCPDDVFALMGEMWDADPQERPTFAYVHTWLTDMVCECISSQSVPEEAGHDPTGLYCSYHDFDMSISPRSLDLELELEASAAVELDNDDFSNAKYYRPHSIACAIQSNTGTTKHKAALASNSLESVAPMREGGLLHLCAELKVSSSTV